MDRNEQQGKTAVYRRMFYASIFSVIIAVSLSVSAIFLNRYTEEIYREESKLLGEKLALCEKEITSAQGSNRSGGNAHTDAYEEESEEMRRGILELRSKISVYEDALDKQTAQKEVLSKQLSALRNDYIRLMGHTGFEKKYGKIPLVDKKMNYFVDIKRQPITGDSTFVISVVNADDAVDIVQYDFSKGVIGDGVKTKKNKGKRFSTHVQLNGCVPSVPVVYTYSDGRQEVDYMNMCSRLERIGKIVPVASVKSINLYYITGIMEKRTAGLIAEIDREVGEDYILNDQGLGEHKLPLSIKFYNKRDKEAALQIAENVERVTRSLEIEGELELHFMGKMYPDQPLGYFEIWIPPLNQLKQRSTKDSGP